MLATKKYDGSELVNIDSGKEISIKDLATLIASKVGYDGEVVWDTNKPNGQPRRMLIFLKRKNISGSRQEPVSKRSLRKL